MDVECLECHVAAVNTSSNDAHRRCYREAGARHAAWVVSVALSAALSCGTTTPSGTATLTVRTIDERTNQLILESAFGITVRVSGSATREQRVTNGLTVFDAIPTGLYTITTIIDYGYRQLDVVSVSVSEAKTYDVRLTPIDDLTATQIVVEGQGSIPKGGTIDVPADGLTIRFQGKYISPRFPWPNPVIFSADIVDVTGRGVGSGLFPQSALALGPSDWAYVIRQWRPCERASDRSVTCVMQSDAIFLSMGKQNNGPSTDLMGKRQAWPLTFRLAPGCCSVVP